MSNASSDDVTTRQGSVVTGLLGLLGTVLVGYGAVRSDPISIAVGGGAMAVALATYLAVKTDVTRR